MDLLSTVAHPSPNLSILPNAVIGRTAVGHPVTVAHMACHAIRGIVLLDSAPDPAGRAVALLRATLAARGFSATHPGYLPIVYLQIHPGAAHLLSMLVDQAFAADQPITVAKGDAWVATALSIAGGMRSIGVRPVASAKPPRSHRLPLYAGLGATLLSGGLLGAAVSERAAFMTSGPPALAATDLQEAAQVAVASPPVASVPEPPLAVETAHQAEAVTTPGQATETLPAPDAPVAEAPAPTPLPAPSESSPEALSPPPSPRPENRDLIVPLIEKGNDAMSRHDTSAARLAYERAANLGSAHAAALLAWSYDPANPKHLPGVDAKLATHWQGRALAMVLRSGVER